MRFKETNWIFFATILWKKFFQRTEFILSERISLWFNCESQVAIRLWLLARNFYFGLFKHSTGATVRQFSMRTLVLTTEMHFWPKFSDDCELICKHRRYLELANQQSLLNKPCRLPAAFELQLSTWESLQDLNFSLELASAFSLSIWQKSFQRKISLQVKSNFPT